MEQTPRDQRPFAIELSANDNLSGSTEEKKDLTTHKTGAFAAAIGVHPLVAFGMCAVDTMLFGSSEALTGMGALVVTIPVGIALAIPCILLQKYASKDHWGAAIGKGLMVGILTAIPFPIGTLPMIGLGILGLRGRASAKEKK